MTTTKEKLLELIKKCDIEEKTLSMEADCDIDEIHVLLRQEIASKEIIVAKLPGGEKAFRMNRHYLGWKAPANPASPWRAPGKGIEAAGPEVKPPAESVSKASLGINFIRENSRVTSAELKVAMDLPSKYSPGQFLGSALKKGLIKRDGDDWVSGDADPKIDIPKFVRQGKAKGVDKTVRKAAPTSTPPPIALKTLIGACRSSPRIFPRTRSPRRSASAICA